MTVAFISGGSSNLGLNIAKRLIETTKNSEKLVLIITSRTLPKALQAIDDLDAFSKSKGKKSQVEFDYVLVDFTYMISVLSAYHELSQKYQTIDLFIVNSIQTCYDGIDWKYAIKDVLTHPVSAVTEAQMKIQRTGCMSHDGMGLLFQGNVFGPYYLIRKLLPLLKNGKVIWISSVMSQSKYLSFDDIQLIKSPVPYEGSKRLIDLIHLGTYSKFKSQYNISEYIVNPGIFTSFAFFEYLNFFTYYGMLMLFYFARFLGSKIHNISGYAGANAVISCARNDDERQDVKVVSCTDTYGNAYISYDEVDPTGKEDVVAYVEKLSEEWDEKFKDQIVETRKP